MLCAVLPVCCACGHLEPALLAIGSVCLPLLTFGRRLLQVQVFSERVLGPVLRDEGKRSLHREAHSIALCCHQRGDWLYGAGEEICSVRDMFGPWRQLGSSPLVEHRDLAPAGSGDGAYHRSLIRRRRERARVYLQRWSAVSSMSVAGSCRPRYATSSMSYLLQGCGFWVLQWVGLHGPCTKLSQTSQECYVVTTMQVGRAQIALTEHQR